jgi:hypothetical protein
MKILTYIYILLLTTLINGCSSSNQKEILEPQIKINKIPPKETHILKEKIDTKSIEKRENRKKNLSYKNNFGEDFGYFDENGYYYNGCYLPYIRGYSYYDRLYKKGRFNPKVRHLRVCGRDYDNGNGYYYLVPDSYTIKQRPMHPEHLEEQFIGSGSYSGLKYDNRED